MVEHLNYFIALEKIYSSDSDRRILWLKHQLQKIKKGSSLIDEYLGQISVLWDVLATAGKSVFDREVILITLDGLGAHYDDNEPNFFR